MNADEQEIRTLIETWMEATRAGDLETILSLMTDDVVFLVCGQAPMVGKQSFREASKAMAAAGAPTFEGQSEIQEVQVLGDWAYLWTRLTVAVTPPGGGRKLERAGHTLSILKKEHGRWRLARDANLLTAVVD